MKQPNWNKTNESMKRVTSCLHVLAFIFNSQPTTGEKPMVDLHCSREIIKCKGENCTAI